MCFAVACIFAVAHANHFLGPIETEATPSTPILEELERVLGAERRVATESRVVRLEDALRPMFQAMPKQSDAGLAPDAVRYVLHRLFVDRHGWYVKGLEAAGEAWNATSPASIFEEHADADVHKLFQQRLEEHSFSLHHVAVLAATLEHFVHTETVDRLHASYTLSGVGKHEQDAKDDEVDGVIDTYMMLYVLGRNHSDVSPTLMEKYRKAIRKAYPTWDATSDWARDVRQELVASETAEASTSFSMTTKVVEEIADRYGHWQDRECQDIKAKLMEIEVHGSGRVPMSAFYSSALSGNWQFSESIPYLRQLGVLDETDPEAPSLVIPNYVNSPSNCVASSKFYEVCCINECEGLLGQLESVIAAPDATPAHILEVVSQLPSATVQSPREMSAELLQRLQEISAQYGGVVPLHSRLFAQWMHHAYPRECPFPHISGTTKPIGAKAYKQQTGGRATMSKEEMEWHVEDAKKRINRGAATSDDVVLPWTAEDELFVCRPEPAQRQTKPQSVGPVIKYSVLIAAFASVAYSSLSQVLRTAREFGVRPQEKYMV